MIYKTQKRKILVNGYAYPNIKPEVLEQWLPSLTFISAFSYSITASGELSDLPDESLRVPAKAANVSALMAVTNIDQGDFSSSLIDQFLESAVAQYQLIDNVTAKIKEKGFIGVNFDFEYIPPEHRDTYTRFIERATRRLNEQGYIVLVAVAPKTSSDQAGLLYEAHDYAGLGNAANFVIPMTYEWGYSYGPPRAVAPLDQVRLVIEYAVSQMDPGKILMGVPNYGYDWQLPYAEGNPPAKSISNEEAAARANKYNAQIMFDEKSQAPYFNYTDENGIEHVVWFEDRRSMTAKLNLVMELNLGGISLWTIMNPFQEGQNVLNEMFDVIKS